MEVEGGVIFRAKVISNSSRTVICGVFNGMLKVKVAAVAEKGKANRNLADFLAKRLGVRKNCVNIISGKTSPVKQIQILGMSLETLGKKLAMSQKDRE
jgi:uncharacterized protein (TIGR00251 family)